MGEWTADFRSGGLFRPSPNGTPELGIGAEQIGGWHGFPSHHVTKSVLNSFECVCLLCTHVCRSAAVARSVSSCWIWSHGEA